VPRFNQMTDCCGIFWHSWFWS